MVQRGATYSPQALLYQGMQGFSQPKICRNCQTISRRRDLSSPHLRCRAGHELGPSVVRVDVHRNVRSRMTGQVLNLFWLQPVLDPTGDAGVPKLVRVDSEVYPPINDIPQAAQRSLRQEAPVLHGEDIERLALRHQGPAGNSGRAFLIAACRPSHRPL